MEGKKDFLDKEGDSIQKEKPCSLIVPVDPSIQKHPDQVENAFLKDRNFFRDLEQELMFSLDGVECDKSSHSHGGTSSDSSFPSTQSLEHSASSLEESGHSDSSKVSSSDYSSRKNTKRYNTDVGMRDSSIVDSVSVNGSDVDYVSPNTLPQENPQSVSKVLPKKAKTASSTKVFSSFTNGMSNRKSGSSEKLDPKKKLNPMREEINQDPRLLGRLSEDKKYSSSYKALLGKVRKHGKTPSSEDKNRGGEVLRFGYPEFPFKSKKSILGQGVKSSKDFQNGHSSQSKKQIQEEKLRYNPDTDDDFEFDIGDLERELLSIGSLEGYSEEISCSGKLKNHSSHRESANPHPQDMPERDLDFDFDQIMDFKDYPEVLRDMDAFLLLDNEENNSLHDVDADPFSGEKKDGAFFENNQGIASFKEKSKERIMSSSRKKKDGLAESFDKDLNFLFKNDCSFKEVSKDSRQESPNKMQKLGNYWVKHQRKWLKICILAIAGYSVYFSFYLYKGYGYFEKKPRIINAMKEMIRIVPEKSAENAVLPNQDREVYDKFSGKKSLSDPIQVKLLESQEKPIDFSQQDILEKDNNSHNPGQDTGSNTDEIKTIVIKKDGDSPKTDVILSDKSSSESSQRTNATLQNKKKSMKMDPSSSENLKKLRYNLPIPSPIFLEKY
ncbi:hypothetical protein [Candidatus Liberibacter sp.]|uniref:hypothetical protein n=1 Tax=Candidatus Liberibacter sp. TaxID=34022 RepID=UPI0015F710C9|nr:hypothetical protein [Candidatus Liberibacter sp.]MBA5724385.1 hypothetical protein [Candidatus Liberibacter sp.]